jgi:hypothetical protein
MFVVSLHRNSVQTCLAFEGYKSGELRGNRILFLHPFFTPSSPPLFFFHLIIMFFSASIALTFVLSFSGIAVHSAPVVRQIIFKIA